jgi:hypothetical protein
LWEVWYLLLCPPSLRSRDFSPVNDVPLHETLGLKSKLQKLEKESSFAVACIPSRTDKNEKRLPYSHPENRKNDAIAQIPK